MGVPVITLRNTSPTGFCHAHNVGTFSVTKSDMTLTTFASFLHHRLLEIDISIVLRALSLYGRIRE
jgi:hypothetical protein